MQTVHTVSNLEKKMKTHNNKFLFQFCLSVFLSDFLRSVAYSTSVSIPVITIIVKHLYTCTCRYIYEFVFICVMQAHAEMLEYVYFTKQVGSCVSVLARVD